MNAPQSPCPESSLFLENDQLKVEIAPPQRYPGTRFGKGAFITQVTCHSEGAAHTFCANELETDGFEAPFQGGSGLCHEFGIFEAVGYDEAQVGEWFPKLDVGLLRRDNTNDYSFFAAYEMQPFPITVEQDGQQICFRAEPLETRGYAARFEQTLRLAGNRLHIACRLENCGSKPIQTHEYRHNFLAFDGRGPEEGLRLRVPFAMEDIQPDTVATVCRKEGSSETCWHWTPSPAYFQEFPSPTNATWWEMEWPGAPVGIREEVSAPMSRFHLFATPRLISPEAFVNITVQPGETLDWERIYTFYPIKSHS